MIKLDGHSLTIEQLVEIARDPSVAVERDSATDKAVARSEALIASIVENYKRAYQKGDAAPIELQAKAKRIPGWKQEQNGLVGVLPDSPTGWRWQSGAAGGKIL